MQIVRRIVFALAALGVLALASLAGASSIREVGVDSAEPFQKPGCPQNCAAITRVTGFQARVGKKKNPYLVGRKGKIVAFTIDLAKPNDEQMAYFTSNFGATPRAGIAVLKMTHKNRSGKLLSRSGTFNLKPYLGTKPTFALNKPLRVPRRSVIALVVPTWAPAFTTKLARSYSWRASRSSSTCEDFMQRAVHMKIGKTRSYGCVYKTARMQYSADFVPDPQPASSK